MLWKNVNAVAASHQSVNANAVITPNTVENAIWILANVIGDVINVRRR